jgi:hypothetical protein
MPGFELSPDNPKVLAIIERKRLLDRVMGFVCKVLMKTGKVSRRKQGEGHDLNPLLARSCDYSNFHFESETDQEIGQTSVTIHEHRPRHLKVMHLFYYGALFDLNDERTNVLIFNIKSEWAKSLLELVDAHERPKSLAPKDIRKEMSRLGLK